MKHGKLTSVGILAGVATWLATGAALAQTATTTTTTTTTAPPPADETVAATPATPPAPEATTTTTTGSAQAGLALPGTAPDAAAGESDHATVVGRLAVGYLGTRGVEVGAEGDEVLAPVIGVRYWLSEKLGIDAGLGIAITSGSTEVDGDETANSSRTAFILHGGVPLSLAAARHFSFQVVPEANLGFGTGEDGDTDVSGFALDLGARAGAEIQFGFIDIPQLSLQAGVGVGIRFASHSSEPDGGVETSTSETTIGTTVGDNPWNIFTSNVAALYYF